MIVVLALALSACGFQLRGTAALPFDTIYIPKASSGVALDLKRNIQGGTRTKVVDDPKAAEAQLELSGETKFRNILSLSGAGRVRELQLVYRVNLRVHDGKGGEFIPLSTLSITRDLTYNDTDILAKEAEEAAIYREMQSDLVQQILRRLSAAQPAKPVVQ
ncbi:MAG: LPS assembly lipoprotein LptE [Betaproteobacteria bacterium]